MTDRKTLCLLPGLMCDETVWGPQSAALQGDCDIYIPRFLGLGSVQAMGERVLAETSGPIWVAGHSMGGRAALEAWRLAPDRVAGLALLDTGVHGPRPPERAARTALVKRAREQGMAAVVSDWLPPMVHPARHGEAALMDPIAGMIRRASPENFEKQQTALLNRPEASGYLANIACPTAVIVGRQDSWSPVAQHEEMAAAIPGAVLTVIEDCGHMSTLERPEAVTAALNAWLAS